MIACLDQQQPRLVADGEAEQRSTAGSGAFDLDPATLCAHFECAPDPTPASEDFGGLVHRRPGAFIRPSSADDVASAVRLAAAHPRLTVAVRGNGHSVNGQAMADSGGLVLDTRALAVPGSIRLVRLPGGAAAAEVSGGALWEEVLEWGVRNHGLAPASWTDYLGLTVGGTLSNGGISGQAFRRGPQVANVAELEVVTGNGERHVCSPSLRPDLFFAALGGLGQFGVITRARIPLVPTPKMVKWIRVVYGEFAEYASDAEWLVNRPESAAFDYVEGFVFVNDAGDPVNGWGSVPIPLGGTAFDPTSVPARLGPVLYCLELGLNYDDNPDEADKRTEEMMRPLKYIRGPEFAAYVTYIEFLSRVKHAEKEARANGSWGRPHPWLNLLVGSPDIADFDREVFKRILRHGIGGPMLVYPLLRSKWDRRMSVAVPESEVFYLVALLRFLTTEAAGAAEAAVAQNREVIECCRSGGYDFKVYIPQYEGEAEWARHFGREWTRFVSRKERYDPRAILAPGQRIFSRARPPSAAASAERASCGR